jgi:hypothetical protein
LGFTVCESHNLSLTFLAFRASGVKRRVFRGFYRPVFGSPNASCNTFVILKKYVCFQQHKKLHQKPNFALVWAQGRSLMAEAEAMRGSTGDASRYGRCKKFDGIF